MKAKGSSGCGVRFWNAAHYFADYAQKRDRPRLLPPRLFFWAKKHYVKNNLAFKRRNLSKK